MKLKPKIKAVAEARFYREQLELIAARPRKTLEQRIARAALTFWDSMARKSKSQNPKPSSATHE